MIQFHVEKLAVTVSDNRKELGLNAAKDAVVYLRTLLTQQAQVNAIFAAAPSQNEFLAALLRQKNIDWTRVCAFHMDEYAGLAQNAKQTFAHYLDTHIFTLASFQSIHYICRSGRTAEEQCKAYTALLQNNPIDVVFMGIGENGHIAFNDPHVAKFNDPELVKIVELDDICRMQQVHDGCFASLGEVPSLAVTLTIPALLSAKRLFCMVPTEAKAQAVKDTLCGEITEWCPASIMRTHRDACLYLDRESAGLLSIGGDVDVSEAAQNSKA